MLELTLRSWSNLAEALHHSHYTYLLVDASTLVPFKWSAPCLHAPPLVALLLRAYAHGASAGRVEGDGRNDEHAHVRRWASGAASIAWLHLPAIALAALPYLAQRASPWGWDSAARSWWIATLSVLCVQLGWAVSVMWLSGLLRHPDGTRRAEVNGERGGEAGGGEVATIGCVVACFACVVCSCHSLHLGLAGSLGLATIGSLGLPLPSTKPPPALAAASRAPSSPRGSRRPRPSRTLAGAGLVQQRWALCMMAMGEAIVLAMLSPVALLLQATAICAACAAAPMLSPVEAAASVWDAAVAHGTLVHAFACAAALPLSVIAASERLRRACASMAAYL